jgi:beta-galactosidase
MTPYKTTILADKKDISVINITAFDKEGREVPDANNMITFSISGPGKIIGVGNGDPSSHEPDKFVNGERLAAKFVQWQMPGDRSVNR